MKHFKDIIVITIAIILLPQLAFAYLDPGTGSYIIQMVIAGLLSVAFLIKTYWSNIKLYLVNRFSKKNDNNG